MSAMVSEEEKINSTLARLYHVINQNKDELIDNILPDCYVNSQISPNNYLKSHESKLIGSTPLHLALNQITILNHLLSRGADFTIKNSSGSTVLHEAIKFIYEDNKSISNINSVWKRRSRFVDSILSAYQNYENINETIQDVNPRDSNGISHFHIACIRNNVGVVNFFLDHGVPINQAVHVDSPQFPGYTPLHFAERFFAFETIKVLLQRGANVDLKDARGMTPLHTFLEQHLKMVDLVHFGKEVPPYVDVKKLDEGVELNLMMMFMKYGKGDDANVVDDIGLSYLHLACAMRNKTLHEHFWRPGININQAVKSNSPMWPGYTAFDFAVKSYNVETIKLLIQKKATLPRKFWFAHCIPDYTTEDVHSIMSAFPHWSGVLFSDGVTKVLDFIYAMRNAENFHVFLNDMRDINVHFRFDATLWPDLKYVYLTPLHLAVLFTARPIDMGNGRADDETLDLGLVQVLLNRGADVTARIQYGLTPLWYAFDFERLRVVHLLLEHSFTNLIGIDQLSTLHIACAAKDRNAVERLLNNGAKPNLPVRYFQYTWYTTVNKRIVYQGQECIFDIRPGFTPLHVAVASESYEIVKMLLARGADRHAKDYKGFTPIHLSLSHSRNYDSERIANQLLFGCRIAEDHLTNINCSYLHVASSLRCTKQVNGVIEADFLRSSNVNIAITSNPRLKTISSLIDKFLTYVGKRREDEPNVALTAVSWLKTKLPWINKFLTYLEIGEEDGTGDREIKYILDRYTPLHFAVKNNNGALAKSLIQNGADIFAKKPNGSTPFYEMLLSCQGTDSCFQYIIQWMKMYSTFREITKKWMEEDSGLTMLHIAAYIRDVDMVKGLLDTGADINAKTLTNSPIWPGYTPLYVLLQTSATVSIHDRSSQQVVDEILRLLLENRADVLLENAKGDSPIYLLDDLCNEEWHRTLPTADRLRKLMANVRTFTKNPVNDQGITLFHLACRYNETNIIGRYLIGDTNFVNLRVDNFNKEFGGCTPLLFILASDWTRWCTEDSCFAAINLLIDSGADINAVDYRGNNAIHCSVSHIEWAPSAKQYSYLIQKLVQEGCNINHQNDQGKTPLHTSAENLNCMAVSELLKAGADVHAVDDHGNNAIHCTIFDEVWDPSLERYAYLIRTLVRNECDINHLNNQGRTPLHIATENQHYQAVSELLLAGADLNVLDENGKPAFAYILEPFFLRKGQWDSRTKNVLTTYILHLCKMQSYGSVISDINKQIQCSILEKFNNNRIDLDFDSREWYHKVSEKLMKKCSTASRIQFSSKLSLIFSL